MTVLLRDDFTGSGHIVGRTPDGVNAGIWVNAPNYSGSLTTSDTIASGLWTEVGSSATHYIGAYAPLTGSPADCYIEARVVLASPATDPGRATLGLRWLEGTPSGWFTGVRVDLSASTTTQAWVQVVRDPSETGMQPGGGYVNYAVANAGSYIARLELQGTAVRLLLDGTLVWSGTQAEANTGGAAFISLGTNGSAGVSLDYVEAGSLAAPPPPASPPVFWQRFVGSHEVP